jgi:hypothetical protein
MLRNDKGALQIREFCMFVNGPFATNIYVDLGQLEEAKSSLQKKKLGY